MAKRFRLKGGRQSPAPARVRGPELRQALAKGAKRAEQHEAGYVEVLEQVFRTEAKRVARRFEQSVTRHAMTAAAPTSASSMVAVYPTLEQAQAIAQPNGEPVEIIHCTLAFLGETTIEQAEQVAAILGEVAADFKPLEGTVGGIASFGSETGVQAEIARVAGLVAPAGGYGETAWNAFARTVWWNPADWTSTEEAEAAEQAFLAIPTVEAVEVAEAESPLPPPEQREWVLVYAAGRALVEPAYPSIALPDVPGLAELRQAVCEALRAAGVPYSELHGWTPHMTLAYLPELQTPPADVLGLPLSFDRVYLTRGDIPRGYVLGERGLVAAGEPPEWSPPHPDEVFRPERFADDVRNKSNPVRQAVIRDAMEAGIDLAGVTFDVTNPFVATVIGKTGAKVTEITETTRLGIMRSIGYAYDEGLSIPDTAKLLREAVEDASKYRSELIARTEMVALVNGGSYAASRVVAEETGIHFVKRWLTADGAKDPRHEDYEDLDGQEVELDEPFDVGGFALMYPGDPDGPAEEVCNCRCAMITVESGEDSRTEQAVGEALSDDDVADAVSETLDVPDAMSAPTFEAPASVRVPAITDEEIATASTEDLWSHLATYGRLENSVRAEIANVQQDRVTAELWRRPETDLPKGTLRWRDVSGEGHFHTFASDGHNSLQEMAEEAMRRGESTMTVADHAHLMTPEAIASQHAEVDRLNALYSGRFRILKGIEANILEDGSLDVSADLLPKFDRVIAGLHANPTFQPTERLVAAARNPYVSTIAHPHAVDADFAAVARAAKEGKTTLEINGRELLRKGTHDRASAVIAAARKEGVPITLGADAHSAQDLVDARYAARFAAQNGVRAQDLAEWQRAEALAGRKPPPGDTVSAARAPFVSPAMVERVRKMGLDLDPPVRGAKAQRLLGKSADTFDLYTNEAGEWDAKRAGLHDQIIAAHFEGKVPDPTSRPQAFFTAGGGASGKSNATFETAKGEISLAELDARKDVVYVDPDRIKQMFPEFSVLRDAGDAFAAAAVHEESSLLGKEILRQATERGYSIVVDSTGSGGSFLSKLQAAAQRGYDVQVTMFSIPTNEAISRSVARGDATGRYITTPAVRQAHTGASANLRIWKEQSAVGRWRVYDNSGPQPELVAEGVGGSTSVYDRERWNAILAKADE